VLEFRQFLLRGLENVRGEWSLVSMAWNLKRTRIELRPGLFVPKSASSPHWCRAGAAKIRLISHRDRHKPIQGHQ